MEGIEALENRLWRLESIDAIQRLQARYSQLADLKYSSDYQRQAPAEMARLAREQAGCFCEDAIWHGAEFGGSLQGREALARWFTQSPWCYAVHYYVSPLIEVDDKEALAEWRLWQLALREDNRQAVFLAANVLATYRFMEGEGWRISSMRFRDVQLLPAADMPLALAGSLELLDAKYSLSSGNTP